MAYGISLDRKDKGKKESSLHFNGLIYTVYRQEFGTQMYVVEIEGDYFNNACGIYLTYMADEFGGYGTENMDKAKYAVESYIANVLHYEFDE